MKNYRVVLWAEFVCPGRGPEEVKQQLFKIIRQERFEEKSFDLTVEAVGKQKATTTKEIVFDEAKPVTKDVFEKVENRIKRKETKKDDKPKARRRKTN